ncbi:hypothetical protein P8452_60175 [Trifolium repens]|nr:hypothetical protein P8452_60175 [Trifolium repens]
MYAIILFISLLFVITDAYPTLLDKTCKDRNDCISVADHCIGQGRQAYVICRDRNCLCVHADDENEKSLTAHKGIYKQGLILPLLASLAFI